MEKKGHFQQSKGFQVINSWLQAQQRHPFVFQEAAWQHIAENDSGLVNAPTGCGKTFAVFLGAIIQYINEFPDSYKNKQSIGLRLIWITPLRALAKDIGRAMEEANAALQIPWKVAIRNGDTPINERQKQKKQPPEVLIITPESLHLVLA
ncbi:MAG: DEAD/DEAH box helicase, partial [Chitinophagaceae bacterium]